MENTTVNVTDAAKTTLWQSNELNLLKQKYILHYFIGGTNDPNHLSTENCFLH